MAPVVSRGVRGRLWDISRGGLAFSIADGVEKFPLGQECFFRIKLPPNQLNPKGIDWESRGTVRNIRPDPASERAIIGLHFENISDDERVVLNRIILFFVQEFAPLNRLDEIFNKKSAQQEQDELKYEELVGIFNQLMKRYQGMDDTMKKEIQSLFRRIGKYVS